MSLPSLDFQTIRQAYARGGLAPTELIDGLFDRIEGRGDDGVWIYLVPREKVLERAAALRQLPSSARAAMPLYGLPFSVKDCIDVAGLPTTAACPAYSYIANRTNLAVRLALDAGAILIGKTNMDQFATGVVGVRTPYGVARNPFDERYIPGGSSSGAAVSIAAGLCSFGFGSDTGGSGRVPASYNNVVGLKPTLGLFSRSDFVNASRSFDTVSVYGLTAGDCLEVLETCRAADPCDPFGREWPSADRRPSRLGSRFTVAVPQARDRRFFGNAEAGRLYETGLDALRSLGGEVVEIDFAPFVETARMMFEGPWLAERYAAVGAFIADHPGEVDPIVREVVLGSAGFSAAEAFQSIYRLHERRREIQAVFDTADVLAVPTVGTVYRIDEIEADPIATNAANGYYMNYVNMADLAAIAVPNGFLASGVPMGMTLVGPAFSDDRLAALGGRLHRARVDTLGATGAGFPASKADPPAQLAG